MNTDKLHPKSLYSISWPLFIELFLHMGMGFLATLMLGFYSDYAAAGVGVANQLMSMFILLFNMTAIGAMILIGHRIGALEYKQAHQLAQSALAINFWLGIILSILMLLFGNDFLQFFDVSDQVFTYASLFIKIAGLSLFLESLSLVLGAILRSHGRTKEPMYVSLLMNLISTIGYVICIFGPFGLPVTGVAGVSWTIIVARAIAVATLFWIVAKELSIRFKWVDLVRIDRHNTKRLFEIGVPSAGENLSYNFSQLIVTGIVATFGDASLAARVYLMNINMLCYLFSIAIGEGTQLLVARYIGAREFTKAWKRGLRTVKIAVFASTSISLTLAYIGEPLIEMFSSDAAIVAIAIPVLWAIAFVEPGRAINIVLMSSLKSAGDVRFPVIIGIFSMWLFSVAFGYVLGVTFGLGLLGVWFAQGVDEWFRALFAVKRWNSRPWQRKFASKFKVKVKTS